MLKDDFYIIKNQQIESDAICAEFQLNEKHRIFNGHFPGKPVLPGVCILQMVKELVESAIGKKLMLTKADSIKFLMIVDPAENAILKLQINYFTTDEGIVNIIAKLLKNEAICFKCSGAFETRH